MFRWNAKLQWSLLGWFSENFKSKIAIGKQIDHQKKTALNIKITSVEVYHMILFENFAAPFISIFLFICAPKCITTFVIYY